MGDNAAMENWGLLTFDERYLLVDSEHMSAGPELQIAKVVAHELVHQWLGNLITPKWWDDTWLSEGLATLFEYIAVDSLYPEIEVIDYHQIDLSGETMDSDTKLDTHPIKFEITGGKNIENAFDTIVYVKSAAILWYVRDQYVGIEKFSQAVIEYLKKHVYGNVEASDLWDELAAVSGKPVDTFMKSWLTQAGFPLLRVSLDLKRRRIILEQERYMPCLEKVKQGGNQHSCQRPEANGQKWIIPVQLTFATDNGMIVERQTHFFGERKVAIELPQWFDLENDDHWFVLNENSKGFYRVLYDDKLLTSKRRNPDWLNPYARASLISDMRANFRYGLIDISKLRDSLSWFPEEREGVVLINLAQAFEVVLGNTRDEEARSQLRKLGRKLFVPIFRAIAMEINEKRFNWQEETGLDSVGRVLVKLGYEPVVKMCLDMFDSEDHSAQLNTCSKVAVKWYGTEEQKKRLRTDD